MLGIFIILILSWGLIHFVEKENLYVLGVTPPDKRLGQFLLSVFAVLLIRIIISGLDTLIVNAEWVHNPLTPAQRYLDALIYHVRSALTEELIFRGVLLYILIKRLGPGWGIGISGMAFGAYHIFSYGLYNAGIFPVIHTILLTGLVGVVWAYAYNRSGSILVPLGLHLGWNYFEALVYSANPFGRLLFMQTSSTEPENTATWIIYYILRTYLPIVLMFLFTRYFIKPTCKVKYIEVEGE